MIKSLVISGLALALLCAINEIWRDLKELRKMKEQPQEQTADDLTYEERVQIANVRSLLGQSETARIASELNKKYIEDIKAALVERYGEAWRDAVLAHYHTQEKQNCLFVAVLMRMDNDQDLSVYCRLVEVDDETGAYHFLSPVKP